MKHLKPLTKPPRIITIGILLTLCLWLQPLPAQAEHPPGAEPAPEEDILTFGVYAHIRSTEILRKFAPLTRHLEGELASRGIDKQIRMKIYSTYPEAIDALASGEVDFVRYGPVSYIKAKEINPRIRLLAMESNAGAKTFKGVIAVPSNSTATTLADLRGGRMAFGDRRSTTGRYLSQAALLEAGITAEDFDTITYLGRHDKVAFAVASGLYDAGAMNENTFNKYSQSKGLRAVVRFDCVTKPWVAREGLDPAVSSALREILLGLDDPDLLKPLKRDGLLPASDSDYNAIRDSMQRAEQFERLQLQFATYASQRPAVIYGGISPILEAVRSRLATEGWHVHFETRILPTYSDAISRIADGDIDIARLGAASYTLAMDRQPALSIIAQERSVAGKIEGVFITRQDTPVTALQDLRGKTLAFANRHSTGGRYYPQALLVRSGITAADLKGHVFLGRHDRVAAAVAAGNYDAGVLRSTVLEKAPSAGLLRVIERFEVPEKLWVTRQGLPDELTAELRSAFTSLGHKDGLHALRLSGFVFPPDHDYEAVRREIEDSSAFGNAP
jgi:phosphonate transport system substrate-binding protein